MGTPSEIVKAENFVVQTQGLFSLSGKASYSQISWSLGAAKLDVMVIVSL